MKKTLMAIGLILAGMLLAAIVLPAFGVSFGWLRSMTLQSRIREIGESFDRVSIDSGACDVFLYKSDSSSCELYTQEGGHVDCSVEVADGTLSVSWSDGRRWYERLTSGKNEYLAVSIYLPKRVYESLDIRTDSGTVYGPDRVGFESMRITTDSGDVSLWDGEWGDMELTSDSGYISVQNSEAKKVAVTGGSGGVSIGGMELEELAVTSDSGDVSVDAVEAAGAIQVTSGSGDIWLWESDGASVSLESDSGDIDASLLTSKALDAHTRSGDSRLDASNPAGGPCTVRSDSGDIRISFED